MLSPIHFLIVTLYFCFVFFFSTGYFQFYALDVHKLGGAGRWQQRSGSRAVQGWQQLWVGLGLGFFFPLYLISFGVTLDEEKKEELNYYDYFFIQSKFWRGCFYFTLVGHQHT